MTIPADYRDPSLENPPTRPTLKLMVIALLVVGAGAVMLNWSQVSAFAHISQIEHAIGF